MKKCTICKELKLFSEFNKKKTSKDGFQNKCRCCSKEYAKQHYNENKLSYLNKNERHRKERREWLSEFKEDLECQVCGESESCCLDFHHRNPKEKDFVIAVAMNNCYSKNRILQEIEKCDVVCSNCHRKIHAGLIDCPVV